MGVQVLQRVRILRNNHIVLQEWAVAECWAQTAKEFATKLSATHCDCSCWCDKDAALMEPSCCGFSSQREPQRYDWSLLLSNQLYVINIKIIKDDLGPQAVKKKHRWPSLPWTACQHFRVLAWVKHELCQWFTLRNPPYLMGRLSLHWGVSLSAGSPLTFIMDFVFFYYFEHMSLIWSGQSSLNLL